MGEYLWDVRMDRVGNLQSWKDRVARTDAIYRGDWAVVFPNEQVQVLQPNVMNLVQVGMDDISRLVSEAKPSVNCFPTSESATATTNAYVREAIAHTYWDINKGDLMVPRLALDLAGTGACFVVVDVDKEHPYPRYHRIDPRMAYPDVHNGMIQDLLVVQVLKLRQAARLFPRLGLMEVPPDVADAVEVLEYYSKDECIQAVAFSKSGQPRSWHVEQPVEITRHWKPDINQVPVAFAQLDSFDGEFRGMFDQIEGSLRTKNRVVKLMMDYTDRMTYAPKVEKGLLNPEAKEGPDTIYELDPNVPDSRLERLGPAGSSPQLFGLLEFLDREHRGATAYPSQRQGQISQSIASATFVAATQGQLTSAVRTIQRLLATAREDLNAISFKLDEKHKDESKPLTRPVGKRKTYTPGEDIDGVHLNQVIYGAGAGLDRINADVRVLQHMQTGLISKETARAQLEYVDDRSEERDKIDREATRDVLSQKFLAEADAATLAEVLEDMESGKSLPEAIRDYTKAQPEPVQQPGLPEGSPEGGGGELAGLSRTRLTKGQVPKPGPRGGPAAEGGPSEEEPLPPLEGPPLGEVLGAARNRRL